MELVARAAFIYVFLFVIMRISGNRQFSGLTNFDVVLLLIISEATQQGLLGNDDFSMTAAFILVGTLVGIDIALSLVKQRSKKADIVMEGVPVLLFLLGYCFGFSWIQGLQGDFLSRLVFIMFGNMLLLLFANNTYLSSVFNAFIVFVPFWMLTRFSGLALHARTDPHTVQVPAAVGAAPRE